jgi:hypothetical protein
MGHINWKLEEKMNLKRKIFYPLLFMSLVFSTSIGFCSQSFIIFRDTGQMGDTNQALGVFQAYQHIVPDVIKVEVSLGDKNQLKAAVEQAIKTDEKKPIVLAVGEKTIIPFTETLPFKGATTVHLCHMVTSHHANMIGKVDFIAVPVHVGAELEKAVSGTNTKLIETVGVAHNRQISVIERVYQDDKARLSPSEHYLGVILAGDAPTPENKMLLFTEENARELARFVASIVKNRYLLITNGPRARSNCKCII